MKLIIEDDEGRKTVVPFVRDEITIGRQEGNTIRLTERNVSRRHARLMRQSAQVMIEDLGSYNGIRVNGDRITGQVHVNDGDLIQIGDYDLAIQREEEARAAGATVPLQPTLSSTAPTMKLPDPSSTMPALPVVSVPEVGDEDVQEAPLGGDEPPKHQSTAVIRIDQVVGARPQRSVQSLQASDSPRLVVLNTDFAGREFACDRTELRVGRTDDNDIALDHRSLSRTHCKVVREDSGEWKVIDTQSANGLMVNGEPYAQVTLRFGDVLELGHVKLKFVGPGERVNVASTTSSNITSEVEQSGSSKGPLIAIVVALVVLIAGGGGYVLFKSSAGADPVKPPKPPLAVTPSKPIAPLPAPNEAVQNRQAEQASNDKLIADAEAALAQLDATTAEALLKQCKVGESPCPRAAQLLAELSNEKGFIGLLKEAKKALDKGDLDQAGDLLQSVSNTRLFRDFYVQLERARQQAVAARVPRPVEPKAVEPEVVPVEPPKRSAQSDQLLKEGREAMKEKNWNAAANKFAACREVDQTNLDCLAFLASALARRGSDESNTADTSRARELYREFLKVAPEADPRVPKIRKILETN